MISLLTGLTTELEIAGVVGLSGFVPLTHEDRVQKMQTERSKRVPMFIGHGDADEMVKSVLAPFLLSLARRCGKWAGGSRERIGELTSAR